MPTLRVAIRRLFLASRRRPRFLSDENGSAIYNLAVTPDGDVWMTDWGPDWVHSAIDRYDPSTGQFTSFPTPTPSSFPASIAVGPDGALRFTESAVDQVGRLDPATGVITEFSGLPAGQIISGPLNSVWFTNPTDNEIGRIDVSTGQVTQYPIPTSDSQPDGITEMPDGSIWFTENAASQLGHLDPNTGSIFEYPVSAPESQPGSIIAGPDGAIWFASSVYDANIGRFDPSTSQITYSPQAVTSPLVVGYGAITQISFAVGPDGGIWFTEKSPALGEIGSNTGQATQHLDQSSTFASAIAAGPGGSVWYFWFFNGQAQLGHLIPSNSLTVQPDSTTIALTASSTAPVAGQEVAFTATVSPAAPGGIAPTGTVTFYDGTTELGSETLNSDGSEATATLTTTNLAAGFHPISAMYSGDADFDGSQYKTYSTVVGSITTVAGDGVEGYSGDGGPATSAELASPNGIAIDYDGDLFIADGNGAVREVLANGTITTRASGISAVGIAVDDQGNLYVTDYLGNASEISPSGSITAIQGLSIYEGLSGDGIATDGQGDLYIADDGHGPIIEFSPDGTETPQFGFFYPLGIAVDSAGDVLYTNGNDSAVREDLPDGTVKIVAGTGQEGYSGDGGPAVDALLNGPTGVAVDAEGNLFISDGSNDVIREVNTAGIITTIAGTGTIGYTGDGGPATSAELNIYTSSALNGIAVDNADNVFFADSANNVIRMIAGGLVVNVQPLTTTNLQSTLTSSQQSGSGGAVTIQANSSSAVGTVVQAVNGLTNSDPSNPETVTLDLGGASTSLSTPISALSGVSVELTSLSGDATIQGTTVDSGTVIIDASVAPVDWTVDGGNVVVEGTAAAGDFVVNGGTVTLADGTVITGNSPAIIVNSGTVILQGVTAQTATDAPTIVVNGGNLIGARQHDRRVERVFPGRHSCQRGHSRPRDAVQPRRQHTQRQWGGPVRRSHDANGCLGRGERTRGQRGPLTPSDLSFTTLVSSGPSTVYGQSVSLTASVRAAEVPDGTPSGNVEFVDTATGAVLGIIPISGGSATLTTTMLGRRQSYHHGGIRRQQPVRLQSDVDHPDRAKRRHGDRCELIGQPVELWSNGDVHGQALGEFTGLWDAYGQCRFFRHDHRHRLDSRRGLADLGGRHVHHAGAARRHQSYLGDLQRGRQFCWQHRFVHVDGQPVDHRP